MVRHCILLPSENIANIHFNPPVITDPSVLVATMSTGAVEPGASLHLKLMPNPSDGLLHVQVTGDELRSAMLRIRGLDGRIHLESRIPGAEAVMDVRALAAGSYMVEYQTGNGVCLASRMLKQ